MDWEIIHVPGNPETSPEESLVGVLASDIEPNLANNLVRKLNQVCPLENLRHVKRVRRRTIEGRVELSVILCLSNEDESYWEGLPKDIHQLISAYQLCPFSVKVPKYAATSREEWEGQCKLWPTSYHPPTNPDGVAGLSKEDPQYIFNYMKIAIQSTKLSYLGGKVVNAAIIVDPMTRQIIASANDQTRPWSTSTQNASRKHLCNDQHKASIASHESDGNGVASRQEGGIPNFPSYECNDSYAAVSCLNPWSWTDQEPKSHGSSILNESNYTWHPLRHAVFVAIENAAERDRQLFPCSGPEAKSNNFNHNFLLSFDDCPAKRQKIQEGSSVKEDPKSALSNGTVRPYLCTGFDIFLVWEPCTMCAMALVHQRIRRIFFALPNPSAGGLGSVYRLHGEKSLNHHYSVFRILIPEKVIRELEVKGSDNYSLQDGNPEL